MPKEKIRRLPQSMSFFSLSPKSKGINVSSPICEKVEHSATISTSSGAFSNQNQDVQNQIEALQFEVEILKLQNEKLYQSIKPDRKTSHSSQNSSELREEATIGQVKEPNSKFSLEALESFFLGLFTAFIIFGILYSCGLFHSLGLPKKRLVITSIKGQNYFSPLNEEFRSPLNLLNKKEISNDKMIAQFGKAMIAREYQPLNINLPINNLLSQSSGGSLQTLSNTKLQAKQIKSENSNQLKKWCQINYISPCSQEDRVN